MASTLSQPVDPFIIVAKSPTTDSRFEWMWKNVDLHYDVTLCVGSDQLIRCHKSVLAASCDYFRAMFSGQYADNSSNTVRFDEGCSASNPAPSASALKEVISFLYVGKSSFGTITDLIDGFRLSNLIGCQELEWLTFEALTVSSLRARGVTDAGLVDVVRHLMQPYIINVDEQRVFIKCQQLLSVRTGHDVLKMRSEELYRALAAFGIIQYSSGANQWSSSRDWFRVCDVSVDHFGNRPIDANGQPTTTPTTYRYKLQDPDQKDPSTFNLMFSPLQSIAKQYHVEIFVVPTEHRYTRDTYHSESLTLKPFLADEFHQKYPWIAQKYSNWKQCFISAGHGLYLWPIWNSASCNLGYGAQADGSFPGAMAFLRLNSVINLLDNLAVKK